MVSPKSLKNLKKWKPGVSGNPKGAPKGKRWRTIFEELLEQRAILPPANTKERKEFSNLLKQFEQKLGREATNRDAAAFRQYILALEGDTYALKTIMEREEGRPAAEIEDLPSDLPLGAQETMTPEQIKELVRIARGEK
jgi:hypothetical protein